MQKKYKYRAFGYAGKLLLCQIISFLATFILMNIFNFLIPQKAPVLSFLCGIVIFGFITYCEAWGRGEGDSNRVKIGIFKENKLFGLLAGVLAAIPSFLIAVTAFLAETGTASFYSVFDYDLFTMVNRMWQLPFSVLFTYVNKTPALNFVFPLFVPFISGIGYFLGFEGISIKQNLLYKHESK